MADANSPVYVNVRIEGRDKTIFEVNISTKGHDVTPQSGGTHPADGTNDNEYPFKVPTCTAALDDSVRSSGLTWAGIFYPSLDDFLVERIGSDTAVSGRDYWQLALNFKRANLGGGQTRIQKADSVVWALIPLQLAPANGLPLLKLKGPKSAKVNTEFKVTVIDGETRQAVEGATVSDGTSTWKTNYQGEASIKYTSVGGRTLKADAKDRYVRSDQLKVSVAA